MQHHRGPSTTARPQGQASKRERTLTHLRECITEADRPHSDEEVARAAAHLGVPPPAEPDWGER